MDLGINGTVVLAHQASLASDGPAVSGEMNLEATLDESKIDSKDVAVSGGANTKLKLTRNATLHGARMGVRSGTNLHVALENSTIASEGTAVCAGYNTEITASHSVISGLPESLRLAGKPNALDLTESSLRGAEVFDAEGCGGGSAITGATAPAPVPVKPVFPHPMPTRAPGLGRTLHVK
jgi:hypothetical protein